MGANFCTRLIKAATKEEAMNAASSFQDQERHEYGHGAYGGHLGTIYGLNVLDQEFATREEAEEYISDEHDKWEPPMLAKCGEGLWLLAGVCPS